MSEPTVSSPDGAEGLKGLWRTGGSKRLYDSPWMSLDLVEVTPPGREPYRHHVVRIPPAVAVLIRRDDGRVLLIRRHRFITGTNGFEVPAGAIDPGESIEDAGRREAMEETGLAVGDLENYYSCSSSDGVSDQQFHFVRCRLVTDTGVVRDDHESSGRVWASPDEVDELLRAHAIPGALTSVALLYDRMGF